MAIFQTSANRKETAPSAGVESGTAARTSTTLAADAARQSLIAAGLVIEGRIEGTGDVRIAGQFKGDVTIEGNLAVDQHAKLNGSLRAREIALAGELEGVIESADRIDLLATAVLVGDIKTNALTVTAGSRIRGNVDCGWEKPAAAKSTVAANNGSDAVF